MAKNKISEFDVNPDNNTDINNINIAEGCAPSGINNAIRQLMSDLKEFQTGGGGDSITAVGLFSDTVGEKTSGAGVTVDGVLLKDGIVSAPVNGTVGATTPASGAFTTLSATGVSTFSAGTVSAPAITTSGDTNTGIFFPAADTIAFSEGGVESMRIDSVGNVGIGVTPSSWSSSAKGLQISGFTTIAQQSTGSSLFGFNYYESATGFRYLTTNPVAMYSSRTDGSHAWFNAPSGTAGNAITFTQAMTLDASGNLGIGNANTSNWLYGGLSVGSGTTNTGLTIYGGTSAETSILFADGTTGLDRYRGYITYGHSTNAMSFGTLNDERMRIDSNGNLLVGTTGLTGTLGRVTTQGVVGVYYSLRCHVPATDTNGQVSFTNPNGLVGQITTSGLSTSYATSSDYRLKDNIAPMTGALSIVGQLKPCTYKWKADGSDGQGFIAHELQAVVPDCVVGEKDAVDSDGNPVYQGIDTSFLVATLTAAIKEQQAIITDLKARIETLESK
jgi:hypothetical protein